MTVAAFLLGVYVTGVVTLSIIIIGGRRGDPEPGVAWWEWALFIAGWPCAALVVMVDHVCGWRTR